VVPEQVILLLVQDNLDLACSAIEKAAMERAVSDVDENFATAYDVRRRHREVSANAPALAPADSVREKLRNSQPFWDPSAPHSTFSIHLPDPLRIKVGGLQPLQAPVYEDFGEYGPVHRCGNTGAWLTVP
jgi:CCR4-NOT transcription complex subunit 1